MICKMTFLPKRFAAILLPLMLSFSDKYKEKDSKCLIEDFGRFQLLIHSFEDFSRNFLVADACRELLRRSISRLASPDVLRNFAVLPVSLRRSA